MVRRTLTDPWMGGADGVLLRSPRFTAIRQVAAMSAGTVRVQHDLRPAVIAGVEMVVRRCGLVEVQLV